LVSEIDALMNVGDVSTALDKLEELRTVRLFGNSNSYFSIIRRLKRFCIPGNRIVHQEVRKINCNRTIKTFCISPDGDKALLGIRNWERPMELWDLSTGKCDFSFEGNTHPVCSSCFSPNGKYALSGSLDDETMRLWEVDTGKCINTFSHTDHVKAVCFSPDGKFAVSGQDNVIRLWDVHRGVCIRTIDGHRKPVSSVCFSPDGSYILSGSFDNTLKIWNVNTGACVRSFEEHVHAIVSVCFSPDGNRILSGGWDHKIKLWDIHTGACVRTIEAPAGNIGMTRFSPDGSKALSVNRNHPTMNLWDLSSGTCIHTFEGYTDVFLSACFSPDGTKIISTTEKEIFIYEIDCDLHFPDWHDWDKGARPFLDIFLTLHPNWTDEDFNHILIPDLQNRGYGWLRPEGIRAELEK